MRKGVIRLSLGAMALVSSLGAGGLAHAGGSCPNTGVSGTSVAVDPGVFVKGCATWNTTSNQGHVWAGGGSGVNPQPSTPVGSVNGFYVAAGNDQVGNADGENGGNTGCGWDERANKYDVNNDPSKACPGRKNKGPYICVATDGGPAYGPKKGILECPVNQP